MTSTEFLKKFHPKRTWVLTAIAPDQKGIETHAFPPGAEDEAKAWISRWNEKRNLYFSVAEVIEADNKKAERENIAAVHWLHVDIDAGAGDLLDELDRIKRLATTKLPASIPKPTCVVYSGGGYQAFWRLKEPVPIQGNLEAAEQAARYNKQLEVVFGADACHNIDRIMRLPGTMNIPNARKIARGRVPVEAKVVSFTQSNYALDSFTMAADVATGGGSQDIVEISGNVARLTSVDDLDQWKVPDRLKVIIVQGYDPDTPKDGDNSRSAWLFDVVCNLVRLSVPDDVVYSVITDPNFKIADSVVEASNSHRYALKQIKSAREAAESQWLYKLNDNFAVIRNIGGQCRIVEEVWDPGLQRSSLVKSTFNDFKNFFMNETETVTTTNSKGNPVIREVPVGKFWLEHPDRRQYDRLVFEPGREVEGAYNLWRGYGCNAIPSDAHESFMAHVFENICSSEQDHYDYLVNWMARAVQHPSSPGGTAFVMRGRPGTGKSFFARHFGQLFGRHFLHITNAGHLIGTFNSHLRDAIVLFGDECFYAGDRKTEPLLKTLISEPTIMVEAKGVDSEPCPNYTHIILASNAAWVVPAGAADRRFFVLDVADTKQRDTTYFAGLERSLKGGGYESMLYELLNRDITRFDVQDIPHTDALAQQKALSLEPHDEWFLQCLRDGRVAGEVWAEKEVTVQNHLVWEDYIQFCAQAPQHRLLSREQLGIYLLRICPKDYPRAIRKRCDGILQMMRTLPPVEACRKSWDRFHSIKSVWEDVSYVDEDNLPF